MRSIGAAQDIKKGLTKNLSNFTKQRMVADANAAFVAVPGT